MAPRKRKLDWARLWFIASSAVIVFAYGVAVGRYQIFPFEILNYAVGSLLQLRAEAGVLTGTVPTWHLEPSRHQGSGVTVLEEDRMAPGLTLVAGFFERQNQIRLIEADGTVVRRWPVHFTEQVPDTDHLDPWDVPQSDWNAQLHGTLALPDGSVLTNFEYAATVKLDRCGEVEWVLARRGHHSLEQAERGGFWIPLRNTADQIPHYPESENGYPEDRIARVSGSGEVVDEIRISELLVNEGLLHLLQIGRGGVFRPGEVVHLNDIEELPTTMADAFPQFEAGDLLLSLRDRNLLMVVDPDDWRVKWHQIGPWIRQHDPDFQSDGTITVFDNVDDGTLDGSRVGGSRILSLDPVTGDVRRLYGGVPGQDMHTNLMGKHQVLPNGNILVTQANGGRLVEVTPAGDIVWELINRFDEDEVAVMTQADRYPPGYFEVADWSCPGDVTPSGAP